MKIKDEGGGHSSLPLISVCVPVLNEEGNIEQLYERLVLLKEKMKEKCRFEYIFTDNHSNDRTWEIIKGMGASDPHVKGLRFSKNFGFQRSILENYRNSIGDAVVQIDADLQDPPELLEVFFDKWVEGYHVVYGIRTTRMENIWISGFRKVGYRVINLLSGSKIPNDAGDFRLIDRKVVNALLSMREAKPYLRGALADIGFEQIGVPYGRNKRLHGESKFDIFRLLTLGTTAVFNHSVLPIRLSMFFGAIILLLCMIGAVYYLALWLSDNQLPRGLASIHILTLVGIGINSVFIGILGEYVYRVHTLIKEQPIAIVQDSVNLET